MGDGNDKVAADLVITGGTVLTLNPNGEIIEDGAVAIKDDGIIAVGPGPVVAGSVRAGRVLEARGGLIMPGLINCHTHAAMTCFRGLADDLPLMTWLNDYIFPAERKMNADMVYCATLLACVEMLRSGTTTFCDMYLFTDQVAQAAAKAGLRAWIGEGLFDFPSPNYGELENGFKYTEELILKWREHPLISITIDPHATYTCSPDLLQRAKDLAVLYDVPIVIHLAETKSEVEAIRARYRHSPVIHLKELGLLDEHLVANHCVVLDKADIEALAENRVKVVHCPESNMKLASGVAPVPQLLEAGITVGIGTDGCASNNNLDLFQEIDTMAKLHKVYCLDPTVIDARTAVRMATTNGAKVLRSGRKIGSIEVGKKADIIVIDMNKPHLTPVYNLYSHLVYAVNGADVISSVINGRVIMENGIIKTVNEEEILSRVREIGKNIRSCFIPA
ncbi:MAG: amidohydrolase [Deltaproteobacteria bacterium]|nr:amidohydrolase [Deltaproteobacteria bacterium]